MSSVNQFNQPQALVPSVLLFHVSRNTPDWWGLDFLALWKESAAGQGAPRAWCDHIGIAGQKQLLSATSVHPGLAGLAAPAYWAVSKQASHISVWRKNGNKVIHECVTLGTHPLKTP